MSDLSFKIILDKPVPLKVRDSFDYLRVKGLPDGTVVDLLQSCILPYVHRRADQLVGNDFDLANLLESASRTFIGIARFLVQPPEGLEKELDIAHVRPLIDVTIGFAQGELSEGYHVPKEVFHKYVEAIICESK